MHDAYRATGRARQGSRADGADDVRVHVRRAYVLRGLSFCQCGRRTNGNHRRSLTWYPCRPRGNNRALAGAASVLGLVVFTVVQVDVAVGVSASSVSLMTVATELMPPRSSGSAIGATEVAALGAGLLGPVVSGVVFALIRSGCSR